MNSKYNINNDMFKKIKKQQPTRAVKVKFPLEIFSADLIQFDKVNNNTEKYKFGLNVVDVLSKKAYTEFLKTKSEDEIEKAFKHLFKTIGYHPAKLYTDQEKAITSSKFQTFLKGLNIQNYHTFGNTHNCIVERFNRTQKENVEKMKANTGETDWKKNIIKFNNIYNNTKHRTIEMKPNDALKEPYNAYLKLNEKADKTRAEHKVVFNIGDNVRISRIKKQFEKGYTNTFTSEIFTIHKVLHTNPKTYLIKDINGEVIKGSFYGYNFIKV